ncbi:MAG: ABC transporter ATP-binding protein [Polyangiaceae bacterium]
MAIKQGWLDAIRGSFSETPRTLALVWRNSPWGVSAMALSTLASATLPLGVAWAGKRIVDAVLASDREQVIRWVLTELALVALLALAARGGMLVRSLVGSSLGLDVNARILDKALTLELRDFEDPELYDQLTKARREASMRPISVVNGTFLIIQSVVSLVGYVALLGSLSGWAIAGLVLSSLPATIAEVKFSGQAFRLRSWRAPESRKLNYLEVVLASDTYAKEVKALGIGPLLLGRYRELGQTIVREDRSLAIKRAFWGWLLSLVATGAFYGCYLALALAAVTRAISLGDMTLYIASLRQGQSAFQSLLSSLGGMYEDNLYMSNLFAYLAAPTREPLQGSQPPVSGDQRSTQTETNEPSTRERATATSSSDEVVRFEKVSFTYPGQPTPALREISLSIRAGEHLAIVGQNGSGKSTLIKLLTGLYTPTSGAIFVDGRDVRAWDREALRSRISVVFQDFNRYQLSLRENVGLGSVEHADDASRVHRSLERAGAQDMIAGLPSGLETALGRHFRRDGVELSGGQWQKVAIARAFMRDEADILILDEPTAALDAEAEQAVFERFQSLTKGRTTVLISHRFPTVRTADRILVLADGAIEEQGSHDALIERAGRYARMFKLQAQGYL